MSEENKHTNVPLSLKDQAFKSRPSLLTRKKYLTVTGEENKRTTRAFDLED